jgi:hypothetical protein
LITEHLHFTASSRHFGEIVTAADVLVIAFVPLFFPRVPFLAMATMMLGVLETVMHIGMIKMFRLPRFYSPGLATAICCYCRSRSTPSPTIDRRTSRRTRM